MGAVRQLALDSVFILQKLAWSATAARIWELLSGFLAVLSISIIIFFYVCVDRRAGFQFLISFLCAVFVACFLGSIIREAHPFQRDDRIRGIGLGERGVAGSSFPSIRCAYVASSSGVFFVYYRSILSYYARFFWIANGLCALSEAVLGRCYLHDSFVGFFLGALVGVLLLEIITGYFAFFDRFWIPISASLFAVSLTGAILAEVGIGFFVSIATPLHLLCAIACLCAGDRIERRLIGCACPARNLKKALRLIVFCLVAFALYKAYFFFVAHSVIGVHIFVIVMSFYCTLGFSWLGTVLALFDRPVD